MSLKQKYGVPELLDDLLDGRVDRRVVAALEARQLERHQVGVAGRELGGPHLLRRVLRVVLRPDVGDVERLDDAPGLDVLAEEARRCRRRSAGDVREDRVAELLELLEDPVVQSPGRCGTAGRAPRSPSRFSRSTSRGSRGPARAGRARSAAAPYACLVRVVALVLGEPERSAPLSNICCSNSRVRSTLTPVSRYLMPRSAKKSPLLGERRLHRRRAWPRSGRRGCPWVLDDGRRSARASIIGKKM